MNVIGLCIIIGALLISGCVPQKVRVYHEPVGALSIIDETKQLVQVRDISWKIPSAWKKLPPQNMRLDGYEINNSAGNSARVTISAFPSMRGQLTANINRWRGQLGLAAIQKDQLSQYHSTKKIGGIEFSIAAFTSPDTKTKLVVAIATFHDQDYFFKLMGASNVVAAINPQFIAMLESVSHVQH
jgi:hypothetical protein